MVGARGAIGGGPVLLHQEKKQEIPSWLSVSYERRSMRERHPRAAIGWNQRAFFLVEVDGRQYDLSVGMTLDELTQLLLKLGC